MNATERIAAGDRRDKDKVDHDTVFLPLLIQEQLDSEHLAAATAAQQRGISTVGRCKNSLAQSRLLQGVCTSRRGRWLWRWTGALAVEARRPPLPLKGEKSHMLCYGKWKGVVSV